MYGQTPVTAPYALAVAFSRAPCIYWAHCVRTSAPHRPASRVAGVRTQTLINVTLHSGPITVVTQHTLLNQSTLSSVIIGSIQSFPSPTTVPLTSYEEPWMLLAPAWWDSAHHFQVSTAEDD